MSLIIPGFLKQFDLPDVIKCISSRDLLLVSATDDIYSKDATAIVEEVYCDLGEPPELVKLQHKQFNGTHALTAERFEFILNWIWILGVRG
jgi:hypothetical protein